MNLKTGNVGLATYCPLSGFSFEKASSEVAEKEPLVSICEDRETLDSIELTWIFPAKLPSNFLTT